MIFYKPTKHKQTSIGQVPEEWETVVLGGICNIYQPKTISGSEILESGPYKVFGANGVIGFYKEYNHKEREVLITCRGATCGTVNMSEPKSWITGNAMVVQPKAKDKVIKKFLFYFLKNIDLKFLITGTAQPQITREPLSIFKIILPPLPEQQKISEVLSKIDEAIEAVSESIEKWQRIKKAAMRHLLTRGIGHKKFRYVEGVGEIPERWAVSELGNIFKFIRGFSYRSRDISNDITRQRLITINNFEKEGGFNFDKGEMYINANVAVDQKFKIQLYDLLIANTDMGKGAIIGAPIYIEEISNNTDLFFSMDLTKLVLKAECQRKIHNKKLIYYLLTLPQIRLLSKSFAQGTNVLHLNHDLFGKIKIAFPLDKEEQDSIVSILQKIDEVIETKQQKKKHLERVKREMMRLLLTGKVRIKV